MKSQSFIKVFRPVAFCIIAISTKHVIAYSPDENEDPYTSHTAAMVSNEYIVHISIDKKFSQYDSIMVTWTVRNPERNRVVSAIRDINIGPVITIVDDKGVERRKEISFAIMSSLHHNGSSGPGEDILVISTDLRYVFGPLAPGQYELLCRWPKDALVIRGEPLGFKISEVFDSLAFTIHEVNVGEFNIKRRERTSLMECHKAVVHGPNLGMGSGTIKNIQRDAFSVKGFPTNRKTYRLAEYWCVSWKGIPIYRSTDSWRPESRELVHAQDIILKPGESINVDLPEWVIDTDGLYFFVVMQYWLPMNEQAPDKLGTPILGGDLHSPLFIVDGFLKAQQEMMPLAE